MGSTKKLALGVAIFAGGAMAGAEYTTRGRLDYEPMFSKCLTEQTACYRSLTDCRMDAAKARLRAGDVR